MREVKTVNPPSVTVPDAADFEIIDDLFCFDEQAAFMRAYFDESGKHGQAQVISICGLLMSARTCKELQRRWFKEAAKPPVIPLPFHMSDCVSGSKSFKHLKDDEPARWKMQERMIKTMRGLDMQAYGAAIIRADYEQVKASLRKPQYQDPWFLAFESAIQETLFRSAEARKSHRISLVFDRQDEFKERAFSLYNELLELGVSHGDRLGGLTFEDKGKFAALQAIDVIVYETTRFVEARLSGQSQRWQSKLIGELFDAKGMVWDLPRLEMLADLKKQEAAGDL